LRPPQIGLDARFALGERRGIGNYSLELFRAMAAVNREFEFVFYSDREDTEGLLTGLPNSRIRVLRPAFYPLWEQVLLPLTLRRDRIDLFHAVGNTAPIRMPISTKLVITLCDVMFMKNEEQLPLSQSWYQRAGRLYRRVVVPTATRRADHLLTISEFSRNDISETLPSIRPEKITVAHLGLPSVFLSGLHEMGASPLEGEPYLLHLGGMDPRKNTRMVIRNFLELKREHRIKEKLVILGLKTLTPFELSPEEFSESEQWICLPGFVPDTVIPTYYRHAQAFLFPSLYEGFGIPLLEAMASGTPIITSNCTSLPEIAGEAALFVDPSNPEELKKAIIRIIDDVNLKSRLTELGTKQLNIFDWESTAKLTLLCYQNILNSVH